MYKRLTNKVAAPCYERSVHRPNTLCACASLDINGLLFMPILCKVIAEVSCLRSLSYRSAKHAKYSSEWARSKHRQEHPIYERGLRGRAKLVDGDNLCLLRSLQRLDKVVLK